MGGSLGTTTRAPMQAILCFTVLDCFSQRQWEIEVRVPTDDCHSKPTFHGPDTDILRLQKGQETGRKFTS